MTTKLPIEFIGGPRDGAKTYLVRAKPTVPIGYPLEILLIDQSETQVGTYVRDGEAQDRDVMRYVWTFRVGPKKGYT